jgi:GAF domain-containing protein
MWDATGSYKLPGEAVPSDFDLADEGLRVLSQFFVDEGTLGDTLLRVAELACQISVADMAGITMLVEGKPETGVFTDPEAPEIDVAQYETGEGPCLDAFRHQQIYRIASTDDDDRWPTFAKDAAAHGIRSTLSMPLSARGEGLGALNLYSRAKVFDEESTAQVEVFARQAAIVLANAQVYWDSRQLSENLNQAMRSRSTIDHAIGILMAGGGRTPEEAFQLLVRASQRENRRLREVAGDIVAGAVDRRRKAPEE